MSFMPAEEVRVMDFIIIAISKQQATNNCKVITRAVVFSPSVEHQMVAVLLARTTSSCVVRP